MFTFGLGGQVARPVTPNQRLTGARTVVTASRVGKFAAAAMWLEMASSQTSGLGRLLPCPPGLRPSSFTYSIRPPGALGPAQPMDFGCIEDRAPRW